MTLDIPSKDCGFDSRLGCYQVVSTVKSRI